LHNEELHNLYASPDIVRVIKSRRMRLARHVVSIGGMKNVLKIFIGKPEGKRPLRKPRRGWEDNTSKYLRVRICGLSTETSGGLL
jgi:hypothetical protein